MLFYQKNPLEYYGKEVSFLGKGTFGKVMLYERDDGEQFAVKFEIKGVTASFIREASILNSLQHPNVVHAIDCGITKEHQPYLVMKLAKMNGYKIHNNIDPKHYKSILYQLCLGVAYLSSRGILHGDIKPQNCLIRQRRSGCYNARIADFGSMDFLSCGSVTDTLTYTPLYRPIELFLKTPTYDISADVWALGCTLYEIYMGKTLLYNMNIDNDTDDDTDDDTDNNDDTDGDTDNNDDTDGDTDGDTDDDDDTNTDISYIREIIRRLGPIDPSEYPGVDKYDGWKNEYSLVPKDFEGVLPYVRDSQLKDLLIKMLTYNPQKTYFNL